MTDALFNWLERVAGIESAESGEGTVWGIEHAWPLASSITVLLIAFAVLFVGACYLRERGSAGVRRRLMMATMRLLVIGLVLLMIAEFVFPLKRTGLPYVVVMLDDSSSMGIVDRYDDEEVAKLLARRIEAARLQVVTRLNLAKTILLEDDGALLRHIDKRYKLKVYFLSDAARDQTGSVDELLTAVKALEPTGATSQLGRGVRTVLNDLRGTPPTAIVLLSDGINTEGESLSEAAGYALRKGVPLFVVSLGSETPHRDLEISDLLVDDVVFVDDVVNFEFKLSGSGYPGRQVEVRLRENGKSTTLAAQRVTIATDGAPQKVLLPYRPTKVGEFQYVVEVENLPDEVQADNNRQQRLVSVRKEQVHALLVQSYPHYEFRYLKHMLQRDNTVELKTVLQEADVEYPEFDPSGLRVFPVRRDELFEYDVIIFGDVDPAFLSPSAISNINAFVTEKGGGLIFIAGPRYTPLAYRDTPLAGLIPIDFNGAAAPVEGQNILEGFRVQPTDLGIASPAMQLGDTPEETAEIWQRLPPVYWLFEAPMLRPAARVLAEHPTRLAANGHKLPVVCMQYVGAGKVLFHATDETWRWRWRVGDVFFARYWVQTLRYLSRAKLLGKDRSAVLSADRREYRHGESVRLRVRFLDERLAPAENDGVTIILEREGQKNRQLKLQRNATSRGIFEGVFSKPADGKYHAWMAAPTVEAGAPSTDFSVIAPPGEFQRVQVDNAELKRISSDTKGRFYTVAESGQLEHDLPKGRQIPIETLPPFVLWSHWLVRMLCVCTFVGLLVGEWILRKVNGML